MNNELTNFNKFRFNDKVFTTNKFTKQKGEFVIEESFEINLYDSRIKSIEFCWIDGMWEISDISYFQYQADPESPKMAGLITLATEQEITQDIMDNDDSAITPINLQKRHSTETRKGIARLATTKEVFEGENNDSIVTPKSLKEILDERITTTFTTKTKYEDIDESEDGYYFKFISSQEDIKKYDIPMINFKEVKFEDKYTYHTDEDPLYGEYLYESFKSNSKHIERLYCDNKEWVRETIDGKNIGWVINYSFHNKPTTEDINAINKDEIILGKVQVKEYLDIIVDENNRLRIYPDGDNQKVSFSWLEGYEDD